MSSRILNDQQLTRYSRHILLPQFDLQGQQRLLESRVFLVGLGGLGSPAALYLAASGIGQLVLNDDDHVELANLQRQIIHSTPNIGQLKTDSAAASLQPLNPDCHITTISQRLDKIALATHIKQADIVIDASDNFATRFVLNELCVKHQTPLLSGAAIRFAGQVALFCNDSSGPCYRCLYPDDAHEEPGSCSDSGVFAPLVGIIGATLAAEAVKLLAGVGHSLNGHILILDALTMQWRTLRLPKDPACPVCADLSLTPATAKM